MVDLTDCDREPIHIPGLIQPLRRALRVGGAVADSHAGKRERGRASFPWRRRSPGAAARGLVGSGVRRGGGSRAPGGTGHDLNPLQIVARGKQFDGIVHRHDGAAILELEPNPGPPLATPHPFREALFRLQRALTLAELGNVVQQMRRVTGFERGLFYRFHEDDEHGSVDAEAKEPALEPYLGLHYSASDIPAQARELYRKNWLRLIFDATAKPARVVPTLRADTGGPLDLSFSVLRSVSPIHLEYMANMGVRASMSVSLVLRDRLWGLISWLNHSGPRRVSQETRTACEFVGRLASLQIAAFEDRDQLAQGAARPRKIWPLSCARAPPRSTSSRPCSRARRS